MTAKIAWNNQGQPPKENKPNVNTLNVPSSSNIKAKNRSFSTPYKGQNKLSTEELEAYKKEGKCFRCGKMGHTYKTCLQRRAPKDPPQVSSILCDSKSPKANALCHVWGKIWDQNAFILMDLGTTHNLISRELAQKLGIKTEEMGCSTNASGPFEGPDVVVTPLIGKLHIHV